MSFLTALALPRRDGTRQPENDHNVDYELCAASERAKVLLQTTQQVKDQLDIVRTLRRKRSATLSRPGKEWIDQAISHTGVAISTTAQLAEPFPEHSSVRRRLMPDASFLRHMRYLISDSSQMTSQLAQLSVASQSLNTAMSILLSCENHNGENGIDATEKDRLPAQEASWQELSELMNRRRKLTAAPVHSSLLPDMTTPLFTKEDFVSQATTDVMGDDGSEGRLVGNVFKTCPTDYTLVLTVEAVEKWRQAVEDVLEKATQASSADMHPDIQPSPPDLSYTDSLPVSPANRPNINVDLSYSKQQHKCESLPAVFPSEGIRSSHSRPASQYNRHSDRTSIPRRKPVSPLYSPQLRNSAENPSTSSRSNYLVSPINPSLQQSYEKETVPARQIPPMRNAPLHEEADPPTLLEIDPEAISPRRSSSPKNFLSKNFSSLSLSTTSSQPFHRSRARVWLERQADSQD